MSRRPFLAAKTSSGIANIHPLSEHIFAYTSNDPAMTGLDPKMTEPKTGLAGLELKDAVPLRWVLQDIKELPYRNCTGQPGGP